jgi:hypothetical protein
MIQLCPRCKRANPSEAAYCHFDGHMLEPMLAPLPVPTRPPPEFAFPGGRRCRTLEEIAQGCLQEWEQARALLRRGDFIGYFKDIQREDLARLAKEAQEQSDADVALYQFVRAMPAPAVLGPRLDLDPRKLSPPAVRAGQRRSAAVVVCNEGSGDLQGRLSVTEGQAWLKLLGGPTPLDLAVRTDKRQTAALLLDARGLIAGQSYSGKLTAVTNGGIAELPVRLDVAAAPFALPPYEGALDPRDLAKRIRHNPRPATALLEDGEIARWFKLNGWTYPIDGPAARGVGAVQQYFEALALSKPPPLDLSPPEIRLQCTNLEPAPVLAVLRTASKKWVYARVESETPWLHVRTPSVSGPRQTAIGLQIEPALTPGDGVHEGQVLVTANGGQRLPLRVVIEVGAPPPETLPEAAPQAPPPPPPAVDKPPPVEPEPPVTNLLID